MREVTGTAIIEGLRKKWVRNAFVSCILMAAGISGIVTIVMFKLTTASWWYGMPLFAITLTVLWFTRKPWKVQTIDIANFLSKKFPSLEESTALLLKPAGELTILEALQAEKTLQALQETAQPAEFIQPLRRAFIMLVLSSILCAGVAIAPFNIKKNTSTIGIGTSVVKEKVLPGIRSVSLSITPPSYTKHEARQQNQFNVRVEEGATLRWQLQTGAGIDKITLVFNDSSTLPLTAINHSRTQWQASKKINSSGFYQVQADGRLSEFYKIETIKDEPPAITVTSPQPNITIEYGEPQKVTVRAVVSDDYGVKAATIIATTASGSGEAVKFKEQTIVFPNSFNGLLTEYRLQKTIDLGGMGMQPADELYFYIKATDNNNQEKHSDIFIVTLADTAGLMETDVVIGNLTLKPEYFRSERQIIIETEQLLKDKDTITQQEFNNRSNNLGIDQKLLRLRYGKFLGDENENAEGGGNGTGILSNPANFGNANAVQDAYTDKHDNAEDATFFSDDVKKQLKAVLTEMWGAETRLRTFKTRDALPYEYRALRLLKDLQQKSRVYVAKTTSKMPPLNPGKRLTGDLNKIIDPQMQVDIPPGNSDNTITAKALSVLEQLRTTGSNNSNDILLFQQAMRLLGSKATETPGVYLGGLQSLTKIIEALQHKKLPGANNIFIAENALQKMTAAPLPLPQKNSVLQ
ncbi:MAG TPA: DUF4175 family protein, partial [Chitinophagaceae bacterium]|nr:DUF4175 family protein [Chitinophagaceae bacterium]